MVKIKICGITRKEDIEVLCNFGVDYIGFILYPPSPRFVGEKIKELILFCNKLNGKNLKKVAVFVDPDYEEVKKVLELGVDLVQLHGKESLSFAKKIGLNRVIKAFRVKDKLSVDEVEEWQKAYAILLDAYKKGVPGGTGISFNWEIAKLLVEKGFKIFLAGGINSTNVEKAIELVNPYAIDVSSGVEKAPGIKDKTKIEELIKKVRKV